MPHTERINEEPRGRIQGEKCSLLRVTQRECEMAGGGIGTHGLPSFFLIDSHRTRPPAKRLPKIPPRWTTVTPSGSKIFHPTFC